MHQQLEAGETPASQPARTAELERRAQVEAVGGLRSAPSRRDRRKAGATGLRLPRNSLHRQPHSQTLTPRLTHPTLIGTLCLHAAHTIVFAVFYRPSHSSMSDPPAEKKPPASYSLYGDLLAPREEREGGVISAAPVTYEMRPRAPEPEAAKKKNGRVACYLSSL